MGERARPIGVMIDELFDLRERKRAAQKQVDLISAEISAQEATVLEAMTREGVVKSTGTKATVSIKDLVVPKVVDWDDFYTYIKNNDYFHLLERRPSTTGCRELFESRGAIPGVVPNTITKVNLRVSRG